FALFGLDKMKARAGARRTAISTALDQFAPATHCPPSGDCHRKEQQAESRRWQASGCKWYAERVDRKS
ncbi:MAG TPA: hypothetical protein VF440_06710, partial [Novosphingobium sp.]